MKGHTRKNLIESYATEDHDVRIYSSGGVRHTVEVESVDTGAVERKTFNSHADATNYARAVQ